MKLIRINKEVFANPSSIDMVELKIVRKKPSIQVHVGGIVRTSDRDPLELIKEIESFP